MDCHLIRHRHYYRCQILEILHRLHCLPRRFLPYTYRKQAYLQLFATQTANPWLRNRHNQILEFYLPNNLPGKPQNRLHRLSLLRCFCRYANIFWLKHRKDRLPNRLHKWYLHSPILHKHYHFVLYMFQQNPNSHHYTGNFLHI